MKKNGNVLIVDDEPNALRVLSAILAREGYNVYNSYNVEKALNIISSNDLDAVITDLRMPDRNGLDLFDYVKRNHPDIPVIFLTAYGTVESAVNTITKGAYYYFIKPPDYPKLKCVLSKAVEERRLRDVRPAGGEMPGVPGCGPTPKMIGRTPEMQKIFEMIRMTTDTSSSVLITGDTGTGKELIAKALHYWGSRRDRPFVAVNCAAIPRDLIESELFGYEKGAFTSAVSKRVGRFEEASGGTMFLDEVGELDIGLQAKLLRVLQEREVERLGSNRKYKVDFRLVCSTNRDLEGEVEKGGFRKDLFYRVNVVQIKVPRLADRKADIPVLVADFMNEFCGREGRRVTLSDAAAAALLDYSWPGNIRQLKNVLERAVVLSRSPVIGREDLPEEILDPLDGKAAETPAPAQQEEQPQPNLQTLREIEACAIRNALDECDGNISRAAKLLGISRKTFYKRLRET